MTIASAVALGLATGLRHALDGDHVAAIGAQVGRVHGWREGLRLALLWGAGHAVTMLAIALPVAAGGRLLPPWFEQVGTLLGGVMLVALGLRSLAAALVTGDRDGVPAGATTAASSSGSGLGVVGIGAVHGLGGSSLATLVASLGLHSPAAAGAYLVVCALGTIIGMALVTTALTLSVTRWLAQPQRTLPAAASSESWCCPRQGSSHCRDHSAPERRADPPLRVNHHA